MIPVGDSLFEPLPAESIEETNLSQGLIIELVLKHVYLEGAIMLEQLMNLTKLSPHVVHTVYRYLLKEQLCETRGMVGEDYGISLTNKGRGMAEVARQKSQYAGPAPVDLDSYRKAVSTQGLPIQVTAQSLKESMSDLVLSDETIHEVGTALVTGGSIMLYGETGNGKTSIGERVHRVFHDHVYIPYALDASGQIITIFDRLVHRAVDPQPEGIDPRWVLCERPMIKVGGELRADMLEPRLDETTRICIAPLQMKANNGVLLIDDFGRQRISPRELLNRWIVPMDRRTDVMSLWSGVSFEIPFEVLIVFATNLSLTDLAEEAFLRRMRNKIKIDPFTPDLFREVVRRVAATRNMTVDPEVMDYFVEQVQAHSIAGLRACYPTDLVGLICGMAKFDETEPAITKASIDRVLKVYFVRD